MSDHEHDLSTVGDYKARWLSQLSLYRHLLHKVVHWGCDSGSDDGLEFGREETTSLSEANVISSKLANSNEHTVMLDLDLPATLIPSSTPGHSHLFIDRVMTWPQYCRILRALSAAGVIEQGFAVASIRRGYTSLRLPWVKKESPEPPVKGIFSVEPSVQGSSVESLADRLKSSLQSVGE